MYSSQVHMKGIPLYRVIHIPISVDTPPGPLILQLGSNIDECCNIHDRAIHTLSILSDTPATTDEQPTTIDYNKLNPYLVGSMLKLSRKLLRTPLNGLLHLVDFP